MARCALSHRISSQSTKKRKENAKYAANCRANWMSLKGRISHAKLSVTVTPTHSICNNKWNFIHWFDAISVECFASFGTQTTKNCWHFANFLLHFFFPFCFVLFLRRNGIDSYPSCSGARAPGLAADMHFRDDVIAFIGPACAFALEPVARLAAYWNSPIITGMGDQVSDTKILCSFI